MMRHSVAVGLSLAICTVLCSCGQRRQVVQSPDVAELAGQFVELMAKGDFSTAVRNFDGAMKQAMSAEKLGEAWRSLTTQVGAFQRQAGVRTAKEQGYDVAYVTCEFENGSVAVKVVFDRAKQISGLWFVPPQ